MHDSAHWNLCNPSNRSRTTIPELGCQASGRAKFCQWLIQLRPAWSRDDVVFVGHGASGGAPVSWRARQARRLEDSYAVKDGSADLAFLGAAVSTEINI